MEDLEKQLGTSSILCQALCITSKPSVHSNWSYSPETPNMSQNGWFFPPVMSKFDRWPWKTIGHLFYATSSFVFHFIAICQFKMELQSGNVKFGSKSAIFCPCDLEIWRMTLKNNRAPLLCYSKLCASFHSHLSIQNGVTVRKCPIWVKIGDFLSRVTLIFDRWPWKTIGHLFYATSTVFTKNFPGH